MPRREKGWGNVSERKDGRWQGAVRVGEGRRLYVYGRTREEAEDKLKTALAAQVAGTPPTSSTSTLGEYLESWLSSVVQATVRPKTFENYARICRVHIIPALGQTKLSKLTPQALQSYYRAKVKGGLSSSSVGRHHAIIHRALVHAVRWELVSRNVADLVDPPRIERVEMRALTVEESRRFLAEAKADRFYALYVLALTTGLRQGELLGLLWSDLDVVHGTLKVSRQLTWSPKKGYSFSELKTKGSRRTIALPPIALEALVEHRAQQLAEKDLLGPEYVDVGLVFANHFGKPVERTNLTRRSFKPIAERIGVPALRFHDLRHTHASLLIADGVSARVVQARLGHSDVSLTLGTYGHVYSADAERAAERIGDLLSDHHPEGASDHQTGRKRA